MIEEKNDLTIAFVGHCSVDKVSEIKRLVESEIPDFHLIFFKASSGKLWVKEGEEP